MELTRKTTILMTPTQHDQMRAEAARRGKSVGQLIREACEQLYLKPPASERLAAIRELGELNLPVAEVAEMKAEYVADDKLTSGSEAP